MTVLRTTLFSVGYAIATLIYGTLSVIVFPLLPRLVRHRLLISWCRLVIVWARLCCGIKFEVQGMENIARGTPAKVILSKHQSTWETLMLQHLFWPASTILKKELLNIPFFGWGLRGLQPIAIDRANPREALRQVKSQGVDRLEEGLNVLIFPEGTRVAPGTKGKYARSGAEIAIAAEADIIPVAVNAGHCWPPKHWRKYPGHVRVVIGEPISPGQQTSRELTVQVEQWIEQEMTELEGQPAVLAKATATAAD